MNGFRDENTLKIRYSKQKKQRRIDENRPNGRYVNEVEALIGRWGHKHGARGIKLPAGQSLLQKSLQTYTGRGLKVSCKALALMGGFVE